MKAGLRIRRSAVADLHAIWAWIEARDPAAADRVIRRIHEAFGLLSENPELGRLRSELDPDLRSFVVERYVIFYRVDRGFVSVRRVLDGSQDIGTRHFQDRA